MNLIQHLQTVRDYRTQPEYPLWVILVLVIMGTMSGCTGYRPLADFVNRHQNDLLEIMSAFSVQQGVVLGLESMRNGDCSEIKTAQVLLEKLQLQGVCFSLDALHTQKKQRSRSLPAAMIT